MPVRKEPLCDSKLVTLSTGANAAADFLLFTEVPVAAHGLGFILDDTQNEFDPNSPNFGEKYAPPFVPVTIRDFTGRVIGKTLSDQYGLYNFLAPSTITTNLPAPSGMSPNMLTTCMNDPGDDPDNPDPNWNQQYSTFCYTFQYMPGVTTYLDTPVVPVAAFTGPDQFPLDCEYPDGTPRIYSVDVQTNGVGGGPYIPTVEVTSGPQREEGSSPTGHRPSPSPRWARDRSRTLSTATRRRAPARRVRTRSTSSSPVTSALEQLRHGRLWASSHQWPCVDSWGEPTQCTVHACPTVGPLTKSAGGSSR